MQSDSGQPSPVMAQVSESGERAGPALPYIVDDVCPAEGCAFGTWEACGPVPGYAEAGDRGTEVFRLSLEESFTVHNGRMRVTEPGPVVIQKSTTVPQGDSTVVFAVGDTAYVLHYVGEGRFNVWYRGAEVETRDFWAWTPPQGELLHEATNEYWVEAETASGQHGWVPMDTGLILAADMRDPTPPTCGVQAYYQALRVVQDFGYTLVGNDFYGRFIHAERRADGSELESPGGSGDYWLLDVSVVRDPARFGYVIEPGVRSEGDAVSGGIAEDHQAVLDSITARLYPL